MTPRHSLSVRGDASRNLFHLFDTRVIALQGLDRRFIGVGWSICSHLWLEQTLQPTRLVDFARSTLFTLLGEMKHVGKVIRLIDYVSGEYSCHHFALELVAFEGSVLALGNEALTTDHPLLVWVE